MRGNRYVRSLGLLRVTVARTLATLRVYRLDGFIPFVAFLFAGAGVLWLVNAIAPLAPLIYSLF